MEVEIEDLHVQMEDISKTKQAVSTALRTVLSVFKSSISDTFSVVTQPQVADRSSLLLTLLHIIVE